MKKLLLIIKENKNSIIEISYDYQNIIYSISLNYSKVFNIDFELDRNLFKDLTLAIENIISKSIFNKIMNKLILKKKEILMSY